MIKLINSYIDGLWSGIALIVITIIILGIICACNAFGNTWTIEDGRIKEVYDNQEECLKSNYGTRTTDKCYDDEQVIYKNRNKQQE